MRNLMILMVAVLGTSVASFAQDGTKKTETKQKTTKTTTIKKSTVQPEKKKEAPVKKVN